MATPEKRGVPLPANEQAANKKPKKGPSDKVYIDLTSNGPWHSVPIIRQDQPAEADPVYDTCFGLLCMQAISSPGCSGPSECTPARLRFEGKVVCISLNTAQDTVAILVSETLSRLVHEFAVTMNATLCGKKQKTKHDSKKQKDQYNTDPRFLSVRIILYGLLQQQDAIADTLAGGGLFLQHPGETEFNRNVKYVNPQYLLGPGQELPPIEELSVSTCCAPHGQRSAKVSDVLNESEVNKVQKIFDTATSLDELIPMIKPSSRLVTQLKRHQIEALVMMVEKEEGIYEKSHFPTIWNVSRGPNEQSRYQNIVTELYAMSPPPPIGGGILADEMGLGKTLSSLSVVCHYLDQINKNLPLSKNIPRTTLVVTPKSTIYGWEQQISNHIHPEKIRWITYYGSNRQETASDISLYDIVITTYDTLRSEEIRKGPLFANEWARVILDEAHRIRNRNSKTFRAVRSLRSRHRWCLTGTPIQNSLDDFGALLEFIQTPSLQTKDLFIQYITRPIKERKKDSIEMLRRVVAATCLRRTKSSHSVELNLPQKIKREVIVRLDPDDRELYEFFKRFSYLMAGNEKVPQRQSATNILVLISILRLICDHGEALLTAAARKAWKERDEKLLTRTMLETNVKQCIFCYSDVEGENGSELVVEELGCGHVICDICVTKLPSSDSQLSCLHCSVDKLQFPSSPTREALSPAGLTNPAGLRSPPSAKLKAILHNILQRQEPSGMNSQPRKAVVFSYWTKMLDLIGNALDERQLSFQRIDGQLSLSQRKEALEKFGNDSRCNIMLASIGAAGEGIDLTAATSVHIVEPHWNPMAESQAVDRVHRIGQTHDVEVVRYIVDESIEKGFV
ncbi:SNF2 family N-terminal domain-containing protein [Talaromyces proteolyticus]|uniref:SNF2 family N-terminal domain-containing protein n=1 Tax=Talaromyces proteolyticus TaxID=1131652 RepID=A0AAD4KYY7_9EURO|nr:SNF2 family N-terminal domain-containing protein [Talaromyces proteolyticus]KAH8704110.1 SNF2 family N-terminal domain-containing protein [Talaromyces proteolyticus]